MPDPDPDALAALREDYSMGGLSEQDVPVGGPMALLRRWTDDAVAAQLRDPTAMVVATVGAEGRPSARTVLCKGMSEAGLVFYTNRTSAKAVQLASEPRCAALFPWHPLQRQVRVEGRTELVEDEVSDAYFASRPRASQLGAWASPQSTVVGSRASLDAAYDEVAARFADGPVPRPSFWGGYRIVPELLEFWQGRSGRLHDRLRFRRSASGEWACERLAP